jgi:hypothetical protein
VYSPSGNTPNARELKFAVTDGGTFAQRETVRRPAADQERDAQRHRGQRVRDVVQGVADTSRSLCGIGIGGRFAGQRVTDRLDRALLHLVRP